MNFKILKDYRFKLLLIVIVISFLIWGVYKFANKLREDSANGDNPYYKAKMRTSGHGGNTYGSCEEGETITTEEECSNMSKYLSEGGILTFPMGYGSSGTPYTLPMGSYQKQTTPNNTQAAGCNFTNYSGQSPTIYWNPKTTDGNNYHYAVWRACGKRPLWTPTTPGGSGTPSGSGSWEIENNYYIGNNKLSCSTVTCTGNLWGSCTAGEQPMTHQECSEFNDWLNNGGLKTFKDGAYSRWSSMKSYVLVGGMLDGSAGYNTNMAKGCNFVDFSNAERAAEQPKVYWNPAPQDGDDWRDGRWRVCNNKKVRKLGSSSAPYSSPTTDIFIDNIDTDPAVSKLMIIDKNTGKTSFVNKTLKDINDSFNTRHSSIMHALKLLFGENMEGQDIPSEFLQVGDDGIIAKMGNEIKNKNPSGAAAADCDDGDDGDDGDDDAAANMPALHGSCVGPGCE